MAGAQATSPADEVGRKCAEVELLQLLYNLEVAEVLLIVPRMLLIEVPWACLVAADGRYLIQRYVIQIAPSLRVERHAAESWERASADITCGQVVLEGNPLPVRRGV